MSGITRQVCREIGGLVLVCLTMCCCLNETRCDVIEWEHGNRNLRPDLGKGEAAVETFKGSIARIREAGATYPFPANPGYQLLGMCLLVEETSGKAKAYIGRKRIPQGAGGQCSVLSTGAGGSIHIGRYSDDMHIERQLITAALQSREKKVLTYENDAVAGKKLVIRSLDAGRDKDLEKVRGTIYIWAGLQPCDGRGTDGGGISCLEYYKELLKRCRDLKIRVLITRGRRNLSNEWLQTADGRNALSEGLARCAVLEKVWRVKIEKKADCEKEVTVMDEKGGEIRRGTGARRILVLRGMPRCRKGSEGGNRCRIR